MRGFSFFLTGALVILLVAGCNFPAPEATEQPLGVEAPTLTSQAVEFLLMTQLAVTAAPAAITPTINPSTAVITPSPQSSPTATGTPRTDLCTDKAEFVEDVNIPDGTLFQAGAQFTKTWRLRNTGTCTWTPQYKLVFLEGDLMGGSETALPSHVAPGATAELSVVLTAPQDSGEYEGKWYFRSADGSTFGIGKDSDKPFFVNISVASSSGGLNLGTPDWEDSFKNAANWYLVETTHTEFSVKNNRMVMEASPGGGDEWGLSTQPALDDFYLEATFKTGETCSGKDRYGMLVRAPNPNAGYVVGFSCDGGYRIYKWDGANYSAVQGWMQSSAILAGPNQTNKLGFHALGSTLKLYANDTLLGEYSDAAFDDGRFGLFIGAVDTDNLKIFVEEIAYWLLD